MASATIFIVPSPPATIILPDGRFHRVLVYSLNLKLEVLKKIRFKFTLAAKVLLPLLTLIYPHLQKLIYHQYDILFKILLHLLVKTITFISIQKYYNK
jgi:hypothetical protein